MFKRFEYTSIRLNMACVTNSETDNMPSIPGPANLPFVYDDTELFWRGVISGGPPQATKDIVGEDALKEAVLPYMTDAGGVRFEHNVFQYIATTAAL